ncbi:MAG: class I SAM-dependent methyltransferase, partial [Pseudomonadota bacterium]
MDRIKVTGDRFELGGERFVMDNRPRDRRPSDDEAFTIVKPEQYLRLYERIARSLKPSGILELGIFEGGSYVFLDKLFEPEAISALDIRKEPVKPLMEYVARAPHRHAHFAISQSDEAALQRIVAEDLGGALDLVVDDASHIYEHTKRSFEILFPLLRPRGVYIVEDWSWAHNTGFQGADSHFADRIALTTLLYEQIALLGSTGEIAEIHV